MEQAHKRGVEAGTYHIRESWESPSLQGGEEVNQSIATGSVTDIKNSIADYLLCAGSFFDFATNTPEQVFHSFMLGIVIGLRDAYIIESNRESGYGRYDLTLLPKDKKNQGVILEFKVAGDESELKSKAEEGLTQIKDKKYTSVLSQHDLQQALLIGLAFYGKKLELAHETLSL